MQINGKSLFLLFSLILGLTINVNGFSKNAIQFLINASFFILITLTFLKVDFSKLRSVKKFKRSFLILFFIDYFLFPLILFLLTKLNILKLAISVPLLFIIIAPSAISSVYFVYLTKGDKEESFLIVLLTHLLFVFILPLIVFIYDRFLGLNIDIFKLLKLVVIFLLIPMSLSYLFQKLRLFVWLTRKKIFDYLTYGLLILIVFLTISSNAQNISKNLLNYLEEITVLFLYFLTYYFLSKFLFKDKKEEKTLLLEFVYKNYVITLILLSYFDKSYIILPVIYVFMVNLFLLWYLNYEKA